MTIILFLLTLPDGLGTITTDIIQQSSVLCPSLESSLHKPLRYFEFRVYPNYFEDKVRVESEAPKFRRAKTKNEFVITASQKDSISIPLIYDEIDLSALISSLSGKDVQIRTKNEIEKTWKTLQGVESDSLIKYMLEKSDNFLAEQMLLLSTKHLYNSFEIDSLIPNQKKSSNKRSMGGRFWTLKIQPHQSKRTNSGFNAI